MDIKTIDINVLTWYDSVNGNSYFAGEITLNYKMQNETTLYMPYQYGYGSQFKHEALKQISSYYEQTVNKYPLNAPYKKIQSYSLWRLEKELNCILRINENIGTKAQLKKVGQ